jgi:hypothetical protein
VEERETSGGSSRRAANGEMKERATVLASQRPSVVGTRPALPGKMAIALTTIREPCTGTTGTLHGAEFMQRPATATATAGRLVGAGVGSFAFAFDVR